MINIIINEDLKGFITAKELPTIPNTKVISSKYENKDAIYNIFDCMIFTYHNETLVQTSFVRNIHDIFVNYKKNVIEFYKNCNNSTIVMVDDNSTLEVNINKETAEYEIRIIVNDN